MREDAGVIRQFAPFAEQRQLFNRVESNHARLRQHFHVLFGIPGRWVVEEGLTRDFPSQEARQVEAVIKGVRLIRHQRNLCCRVERPGGLGGRVSGNTPAHNHQTFAGGPRPCRRDSGVPLGSTLLPAPKATARHATDGAEFRRRLTRVLQRTRRAEPEGWSSRPAW